MCGVRIADRLAPKNAPSAVALLAIFAPGVAAAHGAEAIFFPIGNIASLILVLLVAPFVKVKWRSRVLAIGIASAAVVATWLVPGSLRPYWLPFSAWGSFLVGFVPPLVACVAFLFWRLHAESGRARPAGLRLRRADRRAATPPPPRS